MTTTLSPSDAIEKIWTDLNTEETTKKGVLTLSDGIRASIEDITGKTASTLGLENKSDAEILEELGRQLTEALKTKSTQTAAAGLANVLETLGTLGKGLDGQTDTALYSKARQIGRDTLLKLPRGFISRIVYRFRDLLDEASLTAGVLPSNYRKAIEKAKTSLDGTQEREPPETILLRIRGLVVDLKDTIGDLKKKPGISKANLSGLEKIKSRLNDILRTVISALSTLHSEAEAASKAETKSRKAVARSRELIKEKRPKKGDLTKAVNSLNTRIAQNKPHIKNGLLPKSLQTQLQLEIVACQLKSTDAESKQKAKTSLEEIRQTLPKLLQKDLGGDTSLEAIESVRSALEHHAKAHEYSTVINILDRVLGSGTKTGPKLKEEEARIVESFLIFAHGNRDLNAFLYNKEPKTAAEELLCGFTYVTLEPDTTQQTEEVQTALNESGLQEISERFDEIKRHQGRFERAVKDLDQEQLIHHLFPPLETYYERFESIPEHKEKIEAAIKELREEALSSDNRRAINTAANLLEAYHKALTRYENARADLKSQQNPLSLAHLRAVQHTSRLYQLLNLFPAAATSRARLQNETLIGLKESTVEVSNILYALNNLLQALDSYRPGDIVLDDERRTKAFQGGKKPTYSKMGKGIVNQVRMLKELSKRGIFAVQPFYTGGKTHAACVSISEGFLEKSEVVSDYSQEAVRFTEALTSVAYRPDYVNLITENGRKALENEWGKENVQTRLTQIFAEELTEYLKENESDLKKMKNDAIKAANAFLIGLRKAVPVVARPGLRAAERAILARAPETQEEQEGVTKKFCSEFVSQLIDAVEQRVEARLKKEFRNLPSLFKTIGDVPYEEVHPNRLKSLIQKEHDGRVTYSKMPPPLVVRLLLGENFGRESSPGKRTSKRRNPNV